MLAPSHQPVAWRRWWPRWPWPTAWPVAVPAGIELTPLVLAAGAWAALAVWGGRLAPAGLQDHGRALGHWSLMSAAMMLPLALPLAATVAERTLRRRQPVAVAEALGAYLLVWVVFGAAAHVVLADLVVPAGAAASRALTGSSVTDAAVGGTLGVALLAGSALWRATPVFGRARNRCHRVRPLAPSGPAADLGCVALGSATGLWCTVACGPTMAAMAVLPHSLPVAAGLSVVILAERARWLPLRVTAPALLALAVALAVGLAR